MSQELQNPGEGAALEQQAAWRSLPARALAVLLATDLFFVAMHLLLVFTNQRRRVLFTAFDLGVESNVPTAYSGFQLLLVGVLLLFLSSRLIPRRSKVAQLRLLWRVVGVGFVYLAFDEIGMIHERLPVWRLRVFNIPHLDPWMPMYATIGIVLLVVLARQLPLVWRDWRKQVLLFAGGMAVYISGGFVMEALNYQFHFKDLVRYVEIASEEGCEMVGVSIIAFAVLTILSWVFTSQSDPSA